MRYNGYRRPGLPIVPSRVESTVKRFNHRVKGTEKFWSGVWCRGDAPVAGRRSERDRADGEILARTRDRENRTPRLPQNRLRSRDIIPVVRPSGERDQAPQSGQVPGAAGMRLSRPRCHQVGRHRLGRRPRDRLAQLALVVGVEPESLPRPTGRDADLLPVRGREGLRRRLDDEHPPDCLVLRAEGGLHAAVPEVPEIPGHDPAVGQPGTSPSTSAIASARYAWNFAAWPGSRRVWSASPTTIRAPDL